MTPIDIEKLLEIDEPEINLEVMLEMGRDYIVIEKDSILIVRSNNDEKAMYTL